MSVSVLLPVLLNFGDISEVFFVDFSSMSVYGNNGVLVSDEKAGLVLEGIAAEQESSMPYVPRDQIMEVLNTERELSSENPHSKFRGF